MSELHWHLSMKKSNSTQHLCLPLRRHSSDTVLKTISSARFGSTYTKIGTIQRRLAWPCARMTRKFMKRSIFKKKKQTKPLAARVVTAMQRKPRGRVWGDEEALADSGRTQTEQRKIHGRFGYLLMNRQCPSWKVTSRLRPLCLEHCPRGKLPSLHSTCPVELTSPARCILHGQRWVFPTQWTQTSIYSLHIHWINEFIYSKEYLWSPCFVPGTRDSRVNKMTKFRI